MIKSMTGYGRSEYNDGKRNIIVEIKSVNHRYNDITFKMPRRYSFVEDRLKNLVKDVLRRGKIDVSIIVENITEEDTQIKMNAIVAEQYINNLKELQENFNLTGELDLQFISTLPDVMKSVPVIEDEEYIYQSFSVPLKEALEKLDDMRILEGEKLAKDIIMRSNLIRDYLKQIEERAPQVPIEYKDRLTERIKELLGNNVEIPEDRIVMEATIFADKSNITEELVRLDSHISQLNHIINNSNQPDGRKLDFLVQEMNREVNTIGAKANDLKITGCVVEIKSELEKIREQVQNIE